MLKENKSEHFTKSISYLFLAQILIKILGLIYSLFLINNPKFGDKGNAIYLSGYQIFALMLTFSAIGVPNAVSNLVARCENSNSLNKIFKCAMCLYCFVSVCCTVFLFCFSDFFAEKIIGIKSVSYNLKLLSPILIFATIENVYIGFFNGIKQMKITSKILFIEQFVKTISTIGLVEIFSRFSQNLDILCLGATLGVVVSVIVGVCVCIYEKNKAVCIYKNLYKEKIIYKNTIKKLLLFSVPISIGAMLVSINKNIDSFSIMNVMALKTGKEYAQKMYGIIASKVDVLLAFPLAFNITFSTALIPNISEASKNNNKNKINELVQNSIIMSLMIGFVSALGLCFFSKEIFELLYCNSKDGHDLLKLASFSVLFSVLNQTFSGILQGLQKNRIPVVATVIGTILKLFSNIILIKKTNLFGFGIIISSIISNAIMFIILMKNVQKYICFNFKKNFFITGFFSGVIIILIKLIMKFLIFININLRISFIFSLASVGGGMLLVGAKIIREKKKLLKF